MTAPALLYLLACCECGNGDLVIPFDSPEARGKWAAAHRDSTGHDRWRCAEGDPGTARLDDPSPPEPEKPQPAVPQRLADDERENLLDHLYVVFFARPFQLCGCGDPEAGVRLLVDVLRLHEAEGTIYDRVDAVLGPNAGVQQVILSLLESAELTDHGSSLWSMHLTTKGRWVLWAVDRLGGVDALPDLCGAGENIGYPHNGEECTDACWQIPAGAKR